MKKFKNYDFDREKKMHRVEKGNKVVKHRKAIYNYDVDNEDDLYEEADEHLNEVDTSNTYKHTLHTLNTEKNYGNGF